jgi:hypothetical protein
MGRYQDLALDLLKAGPFVGPRGGKWADAAHTVPWKEPTAKEPTTDVAAKVDALIAQHRSSRGKFAKYPSESMLERAGISVEIPQSL